ncbi:Ribonuclease H-like superfamily [Arabidopsis suecica]|uniref:Ribonuclease H-like superfamily n=1 Tax=Arabidopsis suecica TaxID=45249 RepID=A0A8T2B7V2_ARASU|nr:Ribonuclease H-like superfamily [Arabidopsis suecica]
MTPTIRIGGNYSTHQEYSIDVFGNALSVTVTSDFAIISQWIREVEYNNCGPYYHQPLVVGVGVQWTPPLSYDANPPSNRYYSDQPLRGYDANPPPNRYYSDQPSRSYDANSPPNRYYSDQPPRSYDANPPPSRYYSNELPRSYNANDHQTCGYYEHSSPRDHYADPPQYNYTGNPSRPSYCANPYPGDYISDTERGESNSDPPADTLQLCVGNKCIIIQLGHCDQVPNSLRTFLTDPETTYVGVWNSQDAGKLAISKHQLQIGKLLDVRQYVNDSRGKSMRGCSFEEIVEECMGYPGVRLDPAISMSDWSVYVLDRDQVLQASIDVHVCHLLGVLARLWVV